MELATIALLAFIVNIIVEVTKELPGIVKLPTKSWAIIVSLLVNILSVGIKGTALSVALGCQVLLTSFVVAYIAIFGFDTFKSIYDRFMNNTKGEL